MKQKTQKKTKRTTVEIIIGLLLVGAITFFYFSMESARDKVQLRDVELSTLKDSVEMIEMKNGELVAKIESVEIEKDNLRESLEIAGFDIKELRAQGVKWRKVTNALKLELQAAGSVQTSVTDTFRMSIEVPGDTVWYSTFNNWSNDYMSIYNGEIFDKNLKFDYDYKVGIKIIQAPKRKSTLITVKLTDINARITSANSITVKHKTKWYQKWWLWGSAGLVGGVIIAK